MTARALMITAGLVSFTLIGGSASSWIGCGHSGRPQSERIESLASNPRSAAVIVRVQAWQRTHFVFFRTPPEPLPMPVRRVMPGPVYGINWRLAQSLEIPSAEIWAVPGNRYVCLIERRERGFASSICAGRNTVLDNGLIAADMLRSTPSSPATGRLIVGIVPDGVKEAFIRTGERVASAPVRGGVFVRHDRDTRSPQRVRLR